MLTKNAKSEQLYSYKKPNLVAIFKIIHSIVKACYKPPNMCLVFKLLKRWERWKLLFCCSSNCLNAGSDLRRKFNLDNKSRFEFRLAYRMGWGRPRRLALFRYCNSSGARRLLKNCKTSCNSPCDNCDKSNSSAVIFQENLNFRA